MGYTSDRQPIIGEAPGQHGLWVCVGFNGHGMFLISFSISMICARLIVSGMALTFKSAEALVQLLAGKEKEVDEWLPNCYKIKRLLKSGL